MKRMISMTVVLLLATVFFFGCASTPAEEPAVVAVEESAPAAPEQADGTGVFFVERGEMLVYCKDVPEPGMSFPISTEPGMFQVTVYALDEAGNKLGDITVVDGLIDYSAYENAAKIVVENAASADYTEYVIPPAGTGVFFEVEGEYMLYCTDVPEVGMTFPISTEPGMFQVIVYAVDEFGNNLGDITVTDGIIDYSEYADAAVKIVVEDAASRPYAEYLIP